MKKYLLTTILAVSIATGMILVAGAVQPKPNRIDQLVADVNDLKLQVAELKVRNENMLNSMVVLVMNDRKLMSAQESAIRLQQATTVPMVTKLGERGILTKEDIDTIMLEMAKIKVEIQQLDKGK